MKYSPETQTAIAVVTNASILCQNVRAEWTEVHQSQKADSSPVTVGDFGSQVIINAGIREEFPDAEIIAEETSVMLRPDLDNYKGSVLEAITKHVRRFHTETTPTKVLNLIDIGNSQGGHGRHWSVDPIDGTRGYLRDEQYAVSLGLFEDNEVLTGVLGCPNYPHDITNPDGDKGVLFIAQRGLGMQAVDLKDPTKHLAHIVPSMPRMVERHDVKPDEADLNSRVAIELGLDPTPLSMDSQVKYGAVALGAAQIYLRLKPHRKREFIWDHVPGMLIAEESGAIVTDVDGKRVDLTTGRTLVHNRGILVSKGIGHATVVAALRNILASP